MWRLLDNNSQTLQIVAAPNGALYQRRGDGTILRYTGTPMTGWEVLDHNGATIDIVATANRLYQRHNSGWVYEYIGPPISGWRAIDQNPQTVQIAATRHKIYQRHRDGRIFVYTGRPMIWDLIDHNPETVHIATSDTMVYQRHRSGAVWIYTGPPITGWPRLLSESRHLVVGFDNMLYATNEGGVVRRAPGLALPLMRPEARDAAWQEIDRDPDLEGIAAGGSGRLYKRRRNGSVWSIGAERGSQWNNLESGSGTAELAPTTRGSIYKRDRDGRVWRKGPPFQVTYELVLTRIHCFSKTNQGIWNLTTDDSLALDVITTVERPDGSRTQTIRPRAGIGSNWKSGLDGGPMSLPIAEIAVDAAPTAALVTLVILELNSSGDDFSSDRANILEYAKIVKEGHGLASKVASLVGGFGKTVAAIGSIAAVVDPLILNAVAASSNLYFPFRELGLQVGDRELDPTPRAGTIDFTGHGGHYRISFEWRWREAAPRAPVAPALPVQMPAEG